MDYLNQVAGASVSVSTMGHRYELSSSERDDRDSDARQDL